MYEERLKSIKLSRAWSFYLSSSSSLSGIIRPSGLLHTSTSNIYFNLKSSTPNSASIPNGLLASSLASSWCIRTILMHSYHPDTPHDSRCSPAEVSASNQVRSRPTYSSGLGATGLLSKPSSFSLFWLSWRRTWRLHKGEVLSCVQQGFHPHRHQGVFKLICFTSRRVGDL